MKRAIAALIAMIFVAACSAGASTSPTASAGNTPILAGTSWKAVAVTGRTTVAGNEPTLAFDATKVTGSGGCNGFGGEYAYAAGRLTFGEMPMTLIGCEEPIATIEADFLKVLQAGVTVSIDDGGQLLLEGPGGQAILIPAAP